MFGKLSFMYRELTKPSDKSVESKKIFEGTVGEYIEKYQLKKTPKIDRVEITEIGAPAHLRQNNAAVGQYFYGFMALLALNQVKELSLRQCGLSPDIGWSMYLALKENTTLEVLDVHTYDLKEGGLSDLLEGLQQNQSVKAFYAVGGNVEPTHWTTEQIELLVEVVRSNSTLEQIHLPHSIISKQDMSKIENLYATTEQPLAEIHGLKETPFSNANNQEKRRLVMGSSI
jgi:hypothetical protein